MAKRLRTAECVAQVVMSVKAHGEAPRREQAKTMLRETLLNVPRVIIGTVVVEEPAYLLSERVWTINGYCFREVSWWNQFSHELRYRLTAFWVNCWWPLPFGPYTRERREARR